MVFNHSLQNYLFVIKSRFLSVWKIVFISHESIWNTIITLTYAKVHHSRAETILDSCTFCHSTFFLQFLYCHR